MRALALCVCLLASAALGQLQHTRIRSGGLSKRFPSNAIVPPLVSFLPVGSIATTDECTGAALTGTKGETLTFVRGSSAICVKSDGTLVTLTSNQPRLQSSGIMVEGSNTNLAIRSAAFDNAAWTKTNVTAPTADTQVAPDGTTTAELLVGTANGGLVESTAAAITGTVATASVYVKTTAGTQAMNIVLRDTTAAADRCTGSLTATTTWQRATCSSASITTTNNHTVRIYPGGTAATGTVVAWGAQMEAYAFGTSYVATAGTSVARSADVASLAVPSGMSDTLGCVGATFLVAAFDNGGRVFGTAATGTPMYLASTTAINSYDGTNFVTAPTGAYVGVATRVSTGWVGTTTTLFRGGSSVSGTYDGSYPVGSSIYLGNGSGSGNFLYGTIADVKFGRTVGGCN